MCCHETMPKEQAEYIEKIQNDCLERTNMTKEEAYTFAFRCWQLGYVRVPKEFINGERLITRQHGDYYPTNTLYEILGNGHNHATKYAHDIFNKLGKLEDYLG